MMYRDEYGEMVEIPDITPGGEGTPGAGPIDPRTGQPVVGGGQDPYGQNPGDKSYGYPVGTNPYWDQPGGMANAPKPDPAGGGTGGGGTDHTIAGGQSSFSYPDWTPPNENFGTFSAPKRNITTPFSYADFQGPTADNFQADPGYDFRAKQMDEAIKNNKSAHGLLSTGGTLADLMSYRGGLASQEFGNVWNRQYQAYNTNRGNALDAWKSGESLDNDNFTHDLTSYLTDTQAKQDDWTRNLQTYTTNLNKEAAGYGLNLDTSRLNLQRDNNQFGNLLSLYQIMNAGRPTYTPTA